MTLEGLRLRLQKYRRILFRKYRRNQLDHLSFTIISNNCWGGMIYESYGLCKQSPTVGMFFMAEDYIRFLSSLDRYLAGTLTFVPPSCSRWKKDLESDPRFGSYPVGKLEIETDSGRESVELFFLHYRSEEEARAKWVRRTARIDRERLLVKFNDQNGCRMEHIRAFEQLPFRNKICFTAREYPGCTSVVRHIRTPRRHRYIRASYEPFGNSRQVNITQLINSL